MAIIQRELAVLNQKVAKMGKVNAFLLNKCIDRIPKKAKAISEEKACFSVDLSELTSLLLIMYDGFGME